MIKNEIEDLKKVNLGLQDELADLHRRLKEAKDRGLQLETDLIVNKVELNTESKRSESLVKKYEQASALLKNTFALLDDHDTTKVVRQSIIDERERYEQSLASQEAIPTVLSNGKHTQVDKGSQEFLEASGDT